MCVSIPCISDVRLECSMSESASSTLWVLVGHLECVISLGGRYLHLLRHPDSSIIKVLMDLMLLIVYE